MVDDAEVGFDGGGGLLVSTVDSKVDGDVDDASTLGEVHAEEEDVGPGGVGEVHADGGLFAEDGEDLLVGGLSDFGSNAKGVIGGVAHAEHPLVTANGADGSADLVG